MVQHSKGANRMSRKSRIGKYGSAFCTIVFIYVEERLAISSGLVPKHVRYDFKILIEDFPYPVGRQTTQSFFFTILDIAVN